MFFWLILPVQEKHTLIVESFALTCPQAATNKLLTLALAGLLTYFTHF